MEPVERRRSVKKKVMPLIRRHRTKVISLSASLPDDVRGVFAGSTCVVMCATDPISSLRDSIMEMIRDARGDCDWNDIEELVYCYIALNSSSLHQVIKEAFLSLSSCPSCLDHVFY